MTEPTCISSWIELRKQAEQPIAYSDFDHKNELNEILRAEQHHLCCYCQQRITHYQGKKEGGAHNEHLVPQKLDTGNGAIEMDYNNIYACCIDSSGMSKEHQHCGESKGCKSIRAFIKEINCTEYFKYNLNGEILPNGCYDQWKDYQINERTLAGNIKDAYDTIMLLNLNCNKLATERLKDISSLISIIRKLSKEQVELKIKEFEHAQYYIRYIDMILYYMKKKK
ncbi:MAG: hypothetical protein RR382_07875 [Tannerellaceae bacterium]